MGLLEALKAMTPDEIIDGSNVDDIVEMVDLDVAHRLFLVERAITCEDVELCSYIPSVVEGKKRPDGRYEIRYDTQDGPDFKIVDAQQAKRMRARFLLLRGFYGQNMNHLTLPKQNQAAAAYDIHFIPNILLEKNLTDD